MTTNHSPVNDDPCELCADPGQDYQVLTDNNRRLNVCGDCLRRFGVDEWRSVWHRPSGNYYENKPVYG